ncbi:MAG: FAD-dependent oxidoreductase [Clostridiales bacterium]|nr:FAD-dependent oxidoreductase [Clostridiales bacterium]
MCSSLLSKLQHNETVILIEQFNKLGGTSTIGGVNTWEPGVAGQGIHYQLAKHLLETKQGGVSQSIGSVNRETPYGFSTITNKDSYESTLKRSGLTRDKRRRFTFEPDAMATTMETIITTYPNLLLLYQHQLIDVSYHKEHIDSVIIRNKETKEKVIVKGSYFADCTGDIVLARIAGCKTNFGEDSFDLYKEPSAPIKSSKNINGITQVFRLQQTTKKKPYKMPLLYHHENTKKWMRKINEYKLVPSINQYPNGDLCVNLLPTMDGNEYMNLPKEDRRFFLDSRTFAYFEFLATHKGFESKRISHIFPMIGIRESYRLVGQIVLTENDIYQDTYKENILCQADHALDTHGKSIVKGKAIVELSKPYGIPKECVLTKEFDNLVVASRGSSFSHIVASSCRLTRTMMALGEGAGKLLYQAYLHK